MRWSRLALVCAVAFGAIWAALQLREKGPAALPFLPGCQFRRLTGLQCPGCGMTRATYAVLHGHFGQAFGLNPLGMVLLPVALVGLAPEMLNWVRAKPLTWRLRPGLKTTRLIVACILTFWLLRNTPWWPLPGS
jgi:hypothetical protein